MPHSRPLDLLLSVAVLAACGHVGLAGLCLPEVSICCTLDNCPALLSPDGCYCDELCYQLGGCCDDIQEVCPIESCVDGDVRLTGGSTDLEGRVEVCLNSTWGTVCEDNWDNVDAQVVCEQLGHPNTGAQGFPGGQFGLVFGIPIHIDEVNCIGNESYLLNCSYTQLHDCNHGEDAGVECGDAQCTDGEVRLVDGTSESNGRVEVCRHSVWGTVCDNGWDALDATVICRQLNFTGTRVLSTAKASFGPGTGSINMDNVQCVGDEATIFQCPFVSNSECTHSDDAGVFCGVDLGCVDGEVRLQDGTDVTNGRVEVCLDKHWGSVCNDSFDEFAARVVCRDIGYPSAGALVLSSENVVNASSEVPVHLTGLSCNGHETDLLACQYSDATENCTHAQDIGVQCLPGPGECSDGELRLVDGTSNQEGRLEVCVFERWGTVCDNMFGTIEAKVVCRQLGFPTDGALALHGSFFGPEFGPINLDDVQCAGDEDYLLNCSFTSNVNCFHTNDVSVRCPCDHGDIRLINDNFFGSEREGRVEVCVNGVWGTVTDQSWTTADAQVACRQLGYIEDLAIPFPEAVLGEGEGLIVINNPFCSGDEARLVDCPSTIIPTDDTHADDVGVECFDTIANTVCDNGELRIFPLNLRLEICFDNTWGTVCSDFWDNVDARVACRQLGFADVGTALQRIGPPFAPFFSPIYLDDLDCDGTEEKLAQCNFDGNTGDCLHFPIFFFGGDAGLMCYEQGDCTHGDIRLVGGSSDMEGRVEVCWNGVWGTVQGDFFWNRNDARVVCRQLAHHDLIGIPSEPGQFGPGDGPIVLASVFCDGTEEYLLNCSAFLDTTGASHDDDAGVVCYPSETPPNASCTTGDVRLVDGPSSMEGRVELCINEEWGTVCGNLWTAEDSSVICNQLNFSAGGAISRTDAYYGAGNGTIFLGNVVCDGGEAHLLDCFYTISPALCTHQNDAGVVCQPRMCNESDVRLMDGPNDMEGRVEVCVRGQWGTVCDDLWFTPSALVVCRQLGYYDQYALAFNLAFHSPGTDLPIVLDNVFCEGNESNLLECPHTTSHNCIHQEDAGVRCYTPETFAEGAGNCTHGDTRLVGSENEYEGRVEVCIAGSWGTVCEDRFTQIDAIIVCKSLNFSDAGAVAIPNAAFGEGTLEILMDNVLCFGEEENLVDCLFDPHTTDCTHADDVAVRCFIPGSCTDGDVRLVNGTLPSEGRVELCLSGIWGTVADDGWNSNAARVVCTQLGYSSEYVIDYHNSFYGLGEGAVHIEEIDCQGNEPSLLNCSFSTESTFELHFNDAGVRCFNVTEDVCPPGTVRLANSTNISEGRVEICLDDVWGTVCNDLFSDNDARVVCGQLGFSSEVALRLPMETFSPANDSVPIFLDNVNCTGTESNLLQCGLDSDVRDCTHEEDVSIRCYVPGDCPEGSVRLVDGIQGDFEGRVEVCLHGVWGSVCNDEWDIEDARVVCRELGYSDLYVVTHTSSLFGEGTGPFQISDTLCTGNEDRLLGCVYATNTAFCTHEQSESAVTCYNDSQCNSGDVQLQGGNNTMEGRVEYCIDGVWTTICDFLWDTDEATVICRQLGLSTDFAVGYRGAFYGEGTGEIAFDRVVCTGSEQNISACQALSALPFVGSCDHSNDAGVACYAESQCDDGDVRLADGETELEGRLELCLNGVWGSVAAGFSWGNAEAAVVCRQLGHLDTGVVEALLPFTVPVGPGPIQLSSLTCVGNESMVLDCDFNTDVSFSFHILDIGVRCFESGTCVEGSIVLLNDDELTEPGEGRVEVCVSGVLGTVADDGWDDNDAKVVCRQLGYSDIVAFSFGGAEHGPGEGPIILDNVDCVGNETHLLNCTYTDAFFDFHFEDASVKCFNDSAGNSNCTTGDIQLEGGDNELEGRVEICLGGVWGTICDDFWDGITSNTVCEELGYAAIGSQPYYAAFFGPDYDDPIWLDFAFCPGGEDRLVDCILAYTTGACTHKEDAGVRCLPIVCNNGDLRLVGGDNDTEGRVEVCAGGQWGTVCDDLWDSRDARVVCRQLGHPDTFAVAYDNAFFGLGTEPIAIVNVECDGTEDALINCSLSYDTSGCSHSEDAAVKCFPIDDNAECSDGDVRLIDGESELQGRVEVCVGGSWGTVCNDLWSVDDATVVCRQLEYAEIGTALRSPFPSLNTSAHIDDVRCEGDEDQIAYCSFDFITTDCLSHEDAGVQCYLSDNCTHGDLRLVGSNTAYQGRLEICYNNVWSTISRDFFTQVDAQVACSQLGFLGPGSQVFDGTPFGTGTGPIALDFVTCFGFEETLLDCFFSTESTLDTHDKDVTVKCARECSDNENELRVVDGSTPIEGRVEICLNMQWGTVSDDFWNFLDASVACRQLGYSDQYAIPRQGSYFPPGSEVTPIYLDNVQCSGDEVLLVNCGLSLDTQEDTHDEDAGVTCFIEDGCTHGDIRLADGFVPFEGRVEVCVNGFWGTVSAASWDTIDAKVVCRQLGYSDLYAIPFFGDFGANTAIPVVIGGSFCFGDEDSLVDCSYNPFTAFADPFFTAGVQCFQDNVGTCALGQVRLVDGADNTQGRVEVCVNGVYGTICDDLLWNSLDASVVCRQLGLSATGAMATSFGPGSFSQDIVLDSVVCDGTESNILECLHSPLVSDDCQHTDDAGVICQTGTDCTDGDIRLVGGSVVYEGRVEVCVNGVWGTVCHDQWGTEDATVACRQLNLPTDYVVPFPEAVFGEGTVPILIDDMQCTGVEQSLLNCSYDFRTVDCTHSDDAGVACLDSPQCSVDGSIQLVGGDTVTEGRVEICQSGVWGTLCDDHWGVEDAQVACASLGLPATYSVPYIDAHFGPGVGPIFLADIRCLGTEGQLTDCPSTSDIGTCDHSQDSGVACLSEPQCTIEGDIRLVDGNTTSSGRVELCLNGLWGTIANDFWSSADARVVCTQLGFSNIGAVAVTDNEFGPGEGPIHFDNVFCIGTEVELLDCVHSRVAYEDTHDKDAGVKCFTGDDCEPGSLILVGDSDNNQGRVEICIEGVWGTVSFAGWNMDDARVVCRQLGFDDEIAIPILSQNNDDIPVLVDNVICVGDEASLFDCVLDETGIFDFQVFSAGVMCFDSSVNSICDVGDVRLIEGESNITGRVEVCVGDAWGTICDRFGTWDEDEANVVCSQLGFASVGATPIADSPTGNFNDPIVIGNVACSGDEDKIFDCFLTVPQPSCRHLFDVSVTCLPYVCNPGDVRIVDGPSELEGRVEICFGGAWGTVCDDFWNVNDARVVCGQLGYISLYAEAPGFSEYGQASGLIHLDNVLCDGSEANLLECSFTSPGPSCSHSTDAGVKCFNESVGNCTTGDVRLVGNGNNNYEGTVEVCAVGQWGTVCDHIWGYTEAMVVCQQLGYTEAAFAYKDAFYGTTSDFILFDYVRCRGDESSLLECSYDTNTLACTQAEDAGVRCVPGEECVSGNVRLMGGTTDAEGTVEVCVDGLWGTISDDVWSTADARVICRQLGSYSDEVAVGFGQATFGPGVGVIHLDNVRCRGDEANILDCPSSRETSEDFHTEDAGVRCYQVSGPQGGCTTGDVRLVDGRSEYEGRVEVCFEGVWGTVSDNIWNYNDVLVLCQQLGHSAIGPVPMYDAFYGAGVGPIFVSQVVCFGNEDSILHCSFSPDVADLTHADDAGVQCFPRDGCTSGDVRLVDGPVENEGRVEVCVDSTWGTINGERWTIIDGIVVCRQLGYNDNTAYSTRNAFYGPGSGPIALDEVTCFGNEMRLLDCILGLDTTEDTHNGDVGVSCVPLPSSTPTPSRPTPTPRFADENTVTVVLSGTAAEFTAARQAQFRSATANAVNAYCEDNPDDCNPATEKKRTHDEIEDSDVVIVSFMDVDDGIEVIFYILLEGGSGVLPDDVLVAAVNEGDDYYESAGFTVLSVETTNESGLTGGQRAGIAIAVIILIAIVVLVVALLVFGVYWYYKKSSSGQPKMYLFRSSGSFSNPIVAAESGMELETKSENVGSDEEEEKQKPSEMEEEKQNLAELEGNEYVLEPEKTSST